MIAQREKSTSGQGFYGFAGRQYDRESGQYYNRSRIYNPALGRFTSKDPLGLNGGDTNLYRYVHNNPRIHKDPLGLDGTDPFTDLPDVVSVEIYGGANEIPEDILLVYAGATSAALAPVAAEELGPEAVALYLSNPELANELGLAVTGATLQYLTGENLPFEPSSSAVVSFVGNVSSNLLSAIIGPAEQISCGQ
jgi:RHS repeat-associated protein